MEKDKMTKEELIDAIYSTIDEKANMSEKVLDRIPQSRLASYFASKEYRGLDKSCIIRSGSALDDDELIELELKDKAQEICSHAVERCNRLNKITIVVNKRLYIEKEAFFQCACLQEVVIYCDESDWLYIDSQAASNCPLCRFVYKKKNSDINIYPHLIDKSELLSKIQFDEAFDENRRSDIMRSLFAFRVEASGLKQSFMPFDEEDIQLYFSSEQTCSKNNALKKKLIKSNETTASKVHECRYINEGDYICIPRLGKEESRRVDDMVDLVADTILFDASNSAKSADEPLLDEDRVIDNYHKFLSAMRKNEDIINRLKQARTITYRQLMEISSGVKEFLSLYEQEDTYIAYNSQTKTIRMNVENIATILVRNHLKDFRLSCLLQLFLVRGYYWATAWNRVYDISDANKPYITKLARIISTKALMLYKNEVIQDKVFDDALFLSEDMGDYRVYPEMLCLQLDDYSKTRALNAYALLLERMNKYPMAVWIMLYDYFLGEEYAPVKNDNEAIELLRAYQEYHPRCWLGELLDVFPWVQGSQLKKIGYTAEDIAGLKERPVGDHFSDDKIEMLQISNAVQCICAKAYACCKNLKKLVIYNDSELVIEPLAFAESGLEEIIVHGKGKIIIADFAFQNCANLKQIAIENWNHRISHLSEFSFIGCPDLYVISYPEASKRVLPINRILRLLPVTGLALPDVKSNNPDFSYTNASLSSMQYRRTKANTIHIDEPCCCVHPLAFSYNERICEIVICDPDIKIEAYAFYKLPNLKTVRFKNGINLNNIDAMAFKKTAGFKVELANSANPKKTEDDWLFEEEIKDLFYCQIDEADCQQAIFDSRAIRQSVHLKWLCCNKVWQYEENWKELLEFYFGKDEANDFAMIVFDDEKDDSSKIYPDLKEDVDAIEELCRTGLFKKDENKKEIDSALKEFEKNLPMHEIDMATVNKLYQDLFEKNKDGISLVKRIDDVDLLDSLHMLKKKLSIYFDYGELPISEYDDAKKEIRVYIQSIERMATVKGDLDLSLCLNLIEYAIVYATAQQKLTKFYENCDYSTAKISAVVKGCAGAIALDYLVQNKYKETYNMLYSQQNKGVFPYWPYALCGQLYYQCFEDWKQMRRLLRDIIEKAAKDPNESIRMIDRLCCCEDDDSVYDVLG